MPERWGFLKLRIINYYLAYFFMNLSTRPAVSTTRCLPVKNGWQEEHTSTCKSLAKTEPVKKVLPQPQVTVICLYSG